MAFAALAAAGGVVVAGLVSRKADAFAALLESKDAAGDPALSHMADLVQRLSHVPQPSAAFKASLRDQLVSAASHTAAAASHAATATGAMSSTQAGSAAGSAASSAAGTGAGGLATTITTLGKSAPLWFKLFTGVVAVGVSATGVGVGAHRALPGDLLYGVKRQVEAVQLDLASGKREKATTQLDFARARTHELQDLLKRDDVKAGQPIPTDTAKHINGLLKAWAEDAGVGSTSLLLQIQSLGSKASTAQLSYQLRSILSTFTSQQFLQLGALLPDLPKGSLQSLAVSALGYLQRVDTVLGGNPQTLINQLPVLPQVLKAIPGISTALPKLVVPKTGISGTLGKLTSPLTTPLTKGGKLTLPNPVGSLLPSAVPSGLLPSGVLPSGVLPNALPSGVLPSTGASLPLPLPTVGPSGIQLPNVGALLPSVGNVLPTSGTAAGGGAAGNVPQAVSSSLGSVGGAVGGALGNTVNDATTAAGDTINTATKAAGDTVAQATKAAGDTVAQATKAAGETVNSATKAGGSLLGSVGTTTDASKAAVGTITGGLSSSSGPSLPLPTAIPTLPALPAVTSLPGLH